MKSNIERIEAFSYCGNIYRSKEELIDAVVNSKSRRMLLTLSKGKYFNNLQAELRKARHELATRRRERSFVVNRESSAIAVKIAAIKAREIERELNDYTYEYKAWRAIITARLRRRITKIVDQI